MEVYLTFFYMRADILLIFGTSVLKSNAHKDRHISYILKDGQIPSFTSKRILNLNEYIQPVGDLVLPCDNYRMLVQHCFPKRKILDTSKLKVFANNNFKFDENGKKIFKRVENTVGKGEIARYEQFLLFAVKGLNIE